MDSLMNLIDIKVRTNVANVGTAVKRTQKYDVLLPCETIKTEEGIIKIKVQ